MAMNFGVLGPLKVWSEGKAIEVTGPKRRGLLAYLLAHAGEPQPLDRVVDALWMGAPSRGAESTVQTYVSQLRKLFDSDGPSLSHRAGGYVLELDANALDATRFEAAVSAAISVSQSDGRLALLDDALALWRGAPLEEFAGQTWVDERARQWTRMHVVAHQLRAAALLDAGQHREALSTLEQLVAAHPLHEPFWAQLIVARYRTGQPADALAAAREARIVLATELGIEPGPELVELERKVLSHDQSLTAPAPEGAAGERSRLATVVERLPDGVVTFLLTDIEGSTALWDQHPEEMAAALVTHEEIIAEVVHAHDGRLLKSRGEGDATLSVFPRATDAVTAAATLLRRLCEVSLPGDLELPTRVALHTGEAQLRDGDYYGGTLNRAARIRGLATGGQVLMSRAVHDVVVDVLPPELDLVGFGEYTMKGLQRGETIYSLRGPGLVLDVPVPDTVIIARPRTSFVGRGALVEEVKDALHHPGLVALVGPGGIGKTRLALEVATNVREHFDRVAVAYLADVVDPEAVLPEIAHAIGLATTTDAIDEIVLKLGRAQTLLVLDNCEHLVDACADVVDNLTKRVATLSVLAVSRIALELPGEIAVAVAPLTGADSVRLLVDRGGYPEPEAGSATSDELNEIARRLDGIPLALELTGARLRSMSPGDLLARLPVLDARSRRPSAERHATMRAALDWSYDLLDDEERAALRRLSTFAGFTAGAAEQVLPVGDGDVLSDGTQIVELLVQLVMHSLVVFDPNEDRYRILEPVREYAAELLQREGEMDASRARHAAYLTAVAEMVGRGMAEGEHSRTDLDDDEGNIEAALTWADERHDDETVCRIVGALGFFWFSTNAEQGVRWAERAVARQREVSPALWASTLVAAGQLAQTRSRASRGADSWMLDEAIAIYRNIGRTRALAWALFWRGRMLVGVVDPEQAERDLSEALAKFRTRDDALGIAWSLYFLGALAYEADDDERYESFAAELNEYAASRAPAMLGLSLTREALAALERGDTASALRFIAAAELHHREGDRYNLLNALLDRAWIEARVGTRDRALAALREALKLGRHIGGVDEKLSAIIVAASMLTDDGAAAEAQAILRAAGLLQGSQFRHHTARWFRARLDFVEAHLDLSQPSIDPVADISEAIEWVDQWASKEP